MAINQFNYLDWGNIIINELIGSYLVAIVIFNLLIVYFSVKNSLPNNVMFALMILFNLGMIAYYYNSLILILAAIIIGLLGYGAYSKYLSR